MNQTILILNKVLPVILLIGLGFFLSRKKFLTEQTIGQLRKIVLNISLPAALFLSFLDLRIKTSHLLLVGLMFLLCLVLLAAGLLAKRAFRMKETYLPFLLTGFEYGMLGLGLFGTAFGIEHIGPIALVALGHEVFIWFLFLPLLLVRRDGKQELKATAVCFFTSPVIIAIISSLILNAAGARDLLYRLPVTGAILESGRLLSYLTIPLVLVIIGFGIRIEKKAVGKAFAITACRLAILVPLALLLCRFFIRELLGLPAVYEVALFSFLILPPPFILPLFTKPDLSEDEKAFINNTLVIYAFFSIAVYTLYFVLNRQLVQTL
ncbi:MAG: hypothetical protein JW874_15845 [Spirochaetales bacterium]|nr:hypothetical protein [Spirochaetales bacterium]